jgi:DNA repair protein RecN (Recombination protein N)
MGVDGCQTYGMIEVLRARMLRFLSIQHLAVIDSLEVEFSPGLNVLTGETGAGKSVLVEAVGLLMGGRASPELVRTGESQATIQAIFDGNDGQELIVRREVSAQGRSRGFVNGVLVTANALREITAPLVELHGQHEHQTLLDPTSHLDLLDEFAGLQTPCEAVAGAHRTWVAIGRALDALRIDEREKAARLDLLRFQLGELDRAAPRPGEDEELEARRRVLASAEKLQQLCAEAYSALYESDQAVLAQLGQVWRKVGDLADIDARFAPHLEARDAIKAQLEDLAYALRIYADGIDASPSTLQEIENRLALLERLKRKYGPTLADVTAARASFAQQLDALEHAEGREAELDAACQIASEEYLAKARRLSADRRAAAVSLTTAMEKLLAELAMGRTRFQVRFGPADASEHAWTERGLDQVECDISTNVGEDLRPLARIASGGELSRIMLAVRTLIAGKSPGKTLIFDEIDAGIGGRVADVVGRRLRRLGKTFQVLCITHLPQIAAHGDSHFHIAKSVHQGRTVTQVARLGGRERVEEIARMIGGAEPTSKSRASARELLELSDSE